MFQWAATLLDEAIAWYLYEHVIDGYKFLMQNYNVGDRVCLFGSSGPDGGLDGRQLTGCNFDTRILSWRIHCPSACRDVVQGIIRYYIYVFHLSLTPTRLAMQVGLLSKDNNEQIPFAYKLYKTSSSSDDALARGFKETFCRPVPIEFVGVWWVLMMGPSIREECFTEKRMIDRDTVGSVGVIMGRSLPFVDVNTTIRVFRQALSLDEVCGGWLIFSR
jgi:uncharacterized protein (DUF2235 family)